ncbi:cell division protein ZipA C-terminal FtsZ-binding domain-containing protein [Facilibium subflavum]|uniref:cell division protein ZipA C-terminal FtsZ-binding domain-containing protein n=1 Tax=Facilibium subflavum TaxID=2219058 RepID=UPI000E64B513|nr:cell division protein ZipA C-terminal FtsZ-binding domain-containing protein [Facilibium subflavum]
MNKIQIILLLSIVVVVLLLIDAFRRNKRKRYKAQMAELEALQEQEKTSKKSKKTKSQHKVQASGKQINEDITKIELDDDIKVDPFSQEEVAQFEATQVTYPVLEKGYAVLYISAPRGYVFNGEDLSNLFKQFGLHLNKEEGSFQAITQDEDVLYSLLPDDTLGKFDSTKLHDQNFTGITCVLNANKLVKFYDAVACFDHFVQSVQQLNEKLGGMVLNEHKRRFTSNDESTYRSWMKTLSSDHSPQP